MKKHSIQPLAHQGLPKTEVMAVVEAMRHVLQGWAFLPLDYIGEPVAGPARMPLEWSVRLSGAALCFLNIRTFPEVSALLSHHAQGEGTGPEDQEDAFREFVNIFCGHMVTYLWGKEGAAFDPYIPVPTTPEDWPNANPSASCAFLVENVPVEVRLWIKEKKNEKN